MAWRSDLANTDASIDRPHLFKNGLIEVLVVLLPALPHWHIVCERGSAENRGDHNKRR
jgi:hypothetical protein